MVIMLPIPAVPHVQLFELFLTKLNPLPPAPSVAKTNEPFALIDPLTSNVYSGFVVLTPTIPLLEINILTEPFVSRDSD